MLLIAVLNAGVNNYPHVPLSLMGGLWRGTGEKTEPT